MPKKVKTHSRKKITVLTATSSEDGNRKWDGIDYCFYCNKKCNNWKLTRHLETFHPTKDLVLELSCYKPQPKECPEHLKLTEAQEKSRKQRRIELINKLRVMGNNKHNELVFEKGQGTIRPVKRTKDANIEHFLECSKCGKTMKRTGLPAHIRKCTGKAPGHKCQSMAALRRPLPIEVDDRFKENVLTSMITDDIYYIFTSDRLIMQLAQRHFRMNRDIMENAVRNARTILREMGRLLHFVRTIDPFECRYLEDCLDRTKYDTLFEATRLLTEFQEENNDVKRPQLALNIGPSIQECVEIRQGEVLRKKGDPKAAQDREELILFQELLTREWKKDVTTIARRNKTLKKALKPMMLHLAEDMTAMRTFLKANEKKALKMIENNEKKMWL